MNNQIRISICWLLLIMCMILHFDYHVSEIFYGIDVKKADANGTVPNSIVGIRMAFHFIPILILLMVVSFSLKAVRLVNFVLAVLYTLSHAMHLFGEARATHFNPSQVLLLSVVLVSAIYLSFVSWRWFKTSDTETQQAI